MTDQEAQEQPRKHTKPTRRAWIMRGVVTPIFGLLAVACIVFGVLNSTVWKPSRNITATAQAHSTQYVVIDPGVLDLVDTAVTVSADNGETASSSGTEAGADAAEDSHNQQTSQDQQAQTEPQVCMAVGSSKDVSGWLAGEPYVRVTGLDTWQTLSTSEEQAKGTASTSQNQVAFADSDMWSQVECGSTSTTMHLNNAQPAQVMLIDFGTKAPSADLSMQWVRQRVPDFALPWYFGGGLCAVLAVLSASIFAMDPHARRKKLAESAPAEPKAAKRADEPTIGEALAGTFAALKPRPKKSAAKGTHRRGRHAGAAEDESGQQGAPAVIDPGARNIVAEHASRSAGDETAEHGDEGETTSVISADELQEYFARLAQEVGAEPADAPAPENTGGSADAEVVATETAVVEEQPSAGQSEGKENE